MSIYAEVTINPDSSKAFGVDYLQLDILRFMQRLASGNVQLENPALAIGNVIDDIFKIEALENSPEGAPTNWAFREEILVNGIFRFCWLEGYRLDDPERTGAATISIFGESVVEDYLTQKNVLFMQKADKFDEDLLGFVNQSGLTLRSNYYYTDLNIEKVIGLKYHLWADDSTVLIWTSRAGSPNIICSNYITMIGSPLYDWQNTDDWPLGLVGYCSGAVYENPLVSSHEVAVCGLQSKNIFTGVRQNVYTKDEVFKSFGYGNGTMLVAKDYESYFPKTDEAGNFISQIPIMTNGREHSGHLIWHMAKFPQNNIIYHPYTTPRGYVGQILTIGGKRFLAHALGVSGSSQSTISTTSVNPKNEDVMWLYLPLDN